MLGREENTPSDWPIDDKESPVPVLSNVDDETLPGGAPPRFSVDKRDELPTAPFKVDEVCVWEGPNASIDKFVDEDALKRGVGGLRPRRPMPGEPMPRGPVLVGPMPDGPVPGRPVPVGPAASGTTGSGPRGATFSKTSTFSVSPP